ncbi:hypothetical protein [Sulfitobacter aestuariivivens]|uniref:Uncharacterized protein n=1 Tax=Sulfitobacter aestuariivivens TaxID=2766981 RepID=A0A927D147_9RHOB|nr:hypothetical protein [Sulfitobacter aestuariivivens]MBD3662443.1 hypothetical protein [Sulfitobacter aestuariivivens]
MKSSLVGLVMATIISGHALVTQAAAQDGVFYECDMNVKLPNGWVSPKIGIVIDVAGKVRVIDSVTLNFLKAPAKAGRMDKGNKMRLTWSIPAATDSRGQRIPTFRYVANLDRDTGAIRVIAKPTGAPQSWRGKGTCKTRSGPPPKILR